MSNTYITQSVANTDGFIPEIWAQEALPILRNNVTLAKICAKDSDFGENAFATVGSTLNIGYAGTFTAQDKTANTLLTASVPTGGTSTAVTLSKYKVVPFVIENIAAAQSNQSLMQRLLEPAVVALAEQVENDLFALYSDFTQTAVGTAGTDLVSSVVRSAQKVMNIAKAPQNDRHFIVSPKDLASLEADSNLASYFAYNANNGVIEAGEFARPLYGFNLHMSQLVPVVNGTPNATQNIAMHKNAMILASRPVRPQGGMTVMSAQIQDEVSGLVFNLEAQYNAQAMGLWVNLSCLYGVAALRPDQGVVALA